MHQWDNAVCKRRRGTCTMRMRRQASMQVSFWKRWGFLARLLACLLDIQVPSWTHGSAAVPRVMILLLAVAAALVAHLATPAQAAGSIVIGNNNNNNNNPYFNHISMP